VGVEPIGLVMRQYLRELITDPTLPTVCAAALAGLLLAFVLR
jgi:hypothetical protein